MNSATLQPFLTIDALMDRWGVTRETILEHVRDGRLGFVNLGRGDITKGRRGPKSIGFTESMVADFEASRSVKYPDGTESLPSPITHMDWDGVKRLKNFGRKR